MLGEDAAAIGIDLAEGDGSHSGPLEAEAEAADAGKEVEDRILHRSRFLRSMSSLTAYSARSSIAYVRSIIAMLGRRARSMLLCSLHCLSILTSVSANLTRSSAISSCAASRSLRLADACRIPASDNFGLLV